MQKRITFIASLIWGLINLMVVARLIIYPSSRVKGMAIWVGSIGVLYAVYVALELEYLPYGQHYSRHKAAKLAAKTLMYTGLWSSFLSPSQIGFDNTGAGRVFLGQGLVGLLAGGLYFLYTFREKRIQRT
jgi:hypothetical protein